MLGHCNKKCWLLRSQPANYLEAEVADFFPERVPVEAQEMGRADLIAARRRKTDGKKRPLDLLQHAIVEPRRWEMVSLPQEILREMALDSCAQRLRRAAVRLRRTSDSISAIAYEAGFNDLSTFNRRFRRIMGMTPGAWRRRP